MAPAESTPLLASTGDQHSHHLHNNLFLSLDANHSHDDVHDHPPTPRLHRVKSQLVSATTASGDCHPAHHQLQSPSLHLRFKQSFDHGFRAIWNAVHHGVSTLPHLPASRGPSSPRTATHAVFVIAVLTMLAMTAVSPTVLLFMNAASYTSSTHIAPYVMASALSTAVPIFSNVALSALASRIGPGRALAVASLLAATGILVVAAFRGNLLVFFLAYGLYNSINSMRVVRVALLTKIVAPVARTSVLATHALMTPIGALIGPAIWILCQTFQGSFRAFDSLVVDRFTLVYCAAAVALLVISAVSAYFLSTFVTYEHENDEDQSSQSNTGADTTTGHLHEATLHFADGHDVHIDLARYRNSVFKYFCFIMLGVNMSAGLYMTAFQPIIVNEFHTTDAKLGLIFEIIAIFAVIPPLLVALLSRYLMDRQILVIGLTAKLFGMALFLPLFGKVQEWQVIAGFLLIIKASIFFSTASMSLFSKLLGPMSTSALLGLLASCSAVAPAVTQILLSSHIVKWFGSGMFALFALPAVFSLFGILWPSSWRRLDPSGEFTELVTHEAGVQQAEEA